MQNSPKDTHRDVSATSREDVVTENIDKHHPLRRLLIFQVKLTVDALRDIMLSPVSLIATILDWLEGRKGKNSYFEKLMQFGRLSEAKINLFEQHRGKKKTVDSVLQQVEEVVLREYKEGGITAKTKQAIEQKLKIKQK